MVLMVTIIDSGKTADNNCLERMVGLLRSGIILWIFEPTYHLESYGLIKPTTAQTGVRKIEKEQKCSWELSFYYRY